MYLEAIALFLFLEAIIKFNQLMFLEAIILKWLYL